MQFILKIGPRHCPDESFQPHKDGKNWIGVNFEIPKPKAILGAAIRETIKPGDKAWIWTHVDPKKDGRLRGRGLVGEATIGVSEADGSGNARIQFSEVNIWRRNLLRDLFKSHMQTSEVVTNVFKNTISRSIALSEEQAEEFAGVLAAIDPPQTVERWTDDELLACMLAYCVFRGDPATCTDSIRPPIPI